MNNRLTLDYGMRFVHAAPQYDKLGQATNFLPDKWPLSAAPVLYAPGCAVDRAPRHRVPGRKPAGPNPLTGQLLGPNTSLAIGTLVPGSGSLTNGLFRGGQGIVDTTYTFPALAFAPRFGMAYDLTGKQTIVLRGGDRDCSTTGRSATPSSSWRAIRRRRGWSRSATGSCRASARAA